MIVAALLVAAPAIVYGLLVRVARNAADASDG